MKVGAMDDWIQIKRAVKKIAPEKKEERPSTEPTQLEMDFSLDGHSLAIATKIVQKWRKHPFSCFLLHGGRVKREAVYFYLIKRVLEKERRILFLVPEISLTKGLIKKFEKILGEKVACLHSRLSERKRESEWKRIKEGEVAVVLDVFFFVHPSTSSSRQIERAAPPHALKHE